MLRNGQCVSIVGPRRIGKTSLLFHLCDSEVQKKHNLGEEYLSIYIDCQGLGSLEKPQFYQWLWKEAKRTLADWGETDIWVESITSFSEFCKAMITIEGKGYKPAFLFDEFEAIALNSDLDQDLFFNLRSLVPTVTYIVASQDSLYNLIYVDMSILSSPFFNIFAESHLGFLKPEEAKEMVVGLLKENGQESLFTGEDIAFVFEIGGYHPFFLQLACFYLFEQKMKRKELASADYRIVRQQYVNDAIPHFDYVWKHLGAAERKVVRLVCEGKGDQIDDEQRRRLERKCILHGNGPFSSVFAEFVQRQVTQLEVGEAHRVETNYKSQLDELETQITRMIELLGRHRDIEGVARIRERLIDNLIRLGTNRTHLIELEETLSPRNPMREDVFRRLVEDIQRVKYYVRFEIDPQLRELDIPVDDIGDSLIA
jgi:hypothetical protein